MFQEELGTFCDLPLPKFLIRHLRLPPPRESKNQPRHRGAKADESLQGTHKALHKSQSNFFSNLFPPNAVSEPDPDSGLYDPFPTFAYTGPLRPFYPLSEHREVPKAIKHPDYWRDGIPHSERTFDGRNKIYILDKEAQAGMRKVCRLAREVLDIAAAAAKPGVTTDYIDEIVHKACIERDVRDSQSWVAQNTNTPSHIHHL